MSAEKYNLRNPAVKRIVQELKEIQRDDNPDILAEVLEVSSMQPELCARKLCCICASSIEGSWTWSPCRANLSSCPSPARQDNLFEWHFVIRGAWDTEFEVSARCCLCGTMSLAPPRFHRLPRTATPLD